MYKVNQEKIYYVDDDEYRVFCEFCDKLAIDRFFNKHLKCKTLINTFYGRQRLNIVNTNNRNYNK